MDKYKEIFLGITLNLIGGVIIYYSTLNILVASSLTTFALGIYFSLRQSLSFNKVGIVKWFHKRGNHNNFRNCLKECNSSLKFLASWGGSIPSLSPYTERTMLEMAKKGIQFKFLLLFPGSEGERLRREKRKQWPLGQPETDIRWLLSIKEELPSHYKNNISLRLYHQLPVWAMVILDNKSAIIGFYSDGVGRDNPGILVKNLKDSASFFDAFDIEYDRIWESATKVSSLAGFSDILLKSDFYKTDGFILALTGPSGSGKTTLFQKLLTQKLTCSIKTCTTRPLRDKKSDSMQYEFLSQKEFEKIEELGSLLCSTSFCGYNYGIRKNLIFEAISQKRSLILDTIISPKLLKSRIGKKVIVIYLTPQSDEILIERLNQRGRHNEVEIDVRMKNASEQIKEIEFCDYLVNTNDSIDNTCQLISDLLKAIQINYFNGIYLLPKEYEKYEIKNIKLDNDQNE